LEFYKFPCERFDLPSVQHFEKRPSPRRPQRRVGEPGSAKRSAKGIVIKEWQSAKDTIIGAVPVPLPAVAAGAGANQSPKRRTNVIDGSKRQICEPFSAPNAYSPRTLVPMKMRLPTESISGWPRSCVVLHQFGSAPEPDRPEARMRLLN
jgi:hypothetical protein